MDNLTYLLSIGVTDKETQQRCLDAMAKYSDNKWWEPDADTRALAYYQFNESILLVTPFGRYHKAIQTLVGRPVYTHEFSSIMGDNLKQEVERAWRWQVGCTSDTERQKRVMESIEQFVQWAEENGKQIVIAKGEEEQA